MSDFWLGYDRGVAATAIEVRKRFGHIPEVAAWCDDLTDTDSAAIDRAHHEHDE